MIGLTPKQWMPVLFWLVLLPVMLGWMLGVSRHEHRAMQAVLVAVIPFVFFLIVGVVARYFAGGWVQ